MAYDIDNYYKPEWFPGWAHLIEPVLTELERFNTTYPDFELRVQQIKEKFGGLRLYWNPAYDITEKPTEEQLEWIERIRDMTYAAEEASYSACQDCGEPVADRSNVSGWIATLCPKHLKIRQNERNR